MASVRLADSMLPALARDFGTDAAQAAPVIVLFTLAYGVMQLLWGPLGDRLGSLRVVGCAALAAALGSLACAAAPTLATLSAARLLTGAFCAAIIPLSIAFVGNAVADAVRQATLARLATGTLTGLIAGQVLGGVAADTLGWRTAFVLLALVFVVAGTLALRLERRLARPANAVASPALMAGWASVLRSPGVVGLMVAAALEGGLMFGALAFVPTLLHERADLPLAAAGLAVAAIGAGGLLYVSGAARWIAWLGVGGLLAAGGSLVALGYVVLAAVVVAGLPFGTFAVAIACGLVTGLGFYMLHNCLQTRSTQVAPHARGTAVGLFAVAVFIGQAVGVAALAKLGPWLGFAPLVALCGLGMAALGWTLRARLARRPG